MWHIPHTRACSRKLRHFLWAAALILCGVSSAARADERQYKIEAAYLYSFFNYVTWPGFESPQQLEKPVVCIASGDPILPYLNYVREKMSRERTLSIRAIIDGQSLGGCHILFMRHRTLPDVPLGTLTIFKPDDPLDRGGMIELSEDEDRIVIKINQSQLEQSGFSISSRLLDLAQRVR